MLAIIIVALFLNSRKNEILNHIYKKKIDTLCSWKKESFKDANGGALEG